LKRTLLQGAPAAIDQIEQLAKQEDSDLATGPR
jgi:hypothetical protein